MQDTTSQAVLSRWQAVYRDVRVIGPDGALFGDLNLSTYSLAEEDNRARLKRKFLEAARVVDGDGDGLPDVWELRYLGSLAAQPDDDADGDGFSNFSEWLGGASPVDANSVPRKGTRILSAGGLAQLEFYFRRPAGNAPAWVAEISRDLVNWLPAGNTVRESVLQNLFDGTGTVESTLHLDVGTGQHQFVRWRPFAIP